MSASRPIDCQGRKVVSASDLSLVEATPAERAATTYPNGNSILAGTIIDIYGRFTNAHGHIAYDGSNFPYLRTIRGSKQGWLMTAWLRNAAASSLQRDQKVFTYRAYLDNYTGSAADVAQAAIYVAEANAIFAVTPGFVGAVVDTTFVDADVTAAHLPVNNRDENAP